MRSHKFMIGAVAASLFAFAGVAQADYMIFDSDATYFQEDDSPIKSMVTNFFNETFEDGVVDSCITASGGAVRAPSHNTDSVDFDDSVMDGFGINGASYKGGSLQGSSLRFEFCGDNTPTVAGLVWTDGSNQAEVTFRAYDSLGNMIGSMTTSDLGDGVHNGSALADRFLGVVWEGGISAIEISSNLGGLEVDHVQFGFSGTVVPLPAPLAMGLAGLGVVGLARRRRMKA